MQPLSQRYRTALVTGASSGLGRAFAEMLLAEGVEVWATSRDAQRLPMHDQLHPLALDLADGRSMEAFMRGMHPLFPEIDILVNNAGNGVFGAFEEIAPNDIGEQLRVLLHGPIALCHQVYPHMMARGGGAIVNVASLARDFPLPYFSLYNAAKAGLSNFTRSLQTECVDSGVTVIDFQPGDFKTAFNASSKRAEDFSNERVAQAWASHEKHLNAGPDPKKAALDLRAALQREKSGVVRTGDFFQAAIAPFLTRFSSWNLTERVMRAYYKL
ncbi:SDR family NAD(P)-dependent oxidoreductase [Cerasicoccus fimbriatus]|uniref:SDR family NAD(P)-dependent oxidoreductase n=1 Tax=Cerasicoccus fimbriatus TaxID=3014554 RepID=UPI0022B5DAEE|nr:SDR family NAD(P)-dependent oxidoreductase [Cerasicoccus sp. TK19100]